MANQRIINYIKQSLKKGFAEEKIRKNLLKAYWIPAEVDQAFKTLEKTAKKKSSKEKIVKVKLGFFQKIGLFKGKTKKFSLSKQKPVSGSSIFLGKKPVFGLDISDYSLEAVQLSQKKSIIKLSGLGRIILKPNIIKDGSILQEEALSQSIINLLTNIKFGRIKTNDVVCSLPESQVFSHVFKFPANLKSAQIKEALRFEAEGVIPLRLNEVYYDFLTASATAEETLNSSEQEVFFVAARKDIVESYVRVLLATGLHPLALENESFSLTRSLFRESKIKITKTPAGVPIPLRGTMILDIGARTTNLSIVDRQGIRMAVNVSIAGDKFSESIAHTLGISLLEADKMKREYGLSKEVRQGKLFIVLSALLQEIFGEIKKAIFYYEGEKKGKITKVLLAGGSSQMPGLIDYFIESLSGPINEKRSLVERIEIKIGNPWSDIEFEANLAPKYLEENMETFLENMKTALARRSILYATAIGISLRGLAQDPAKAGINLLPEKLEKRA